MVILRAMSEKALWNITHATTSTELRYPGWVGLFRESSTLGKEYSFINDIEKADIHTYIRTYVRTYVHTYIHTYIHIYIYMQGEDYTIPYSGMPGSLDMQPYSTAKSFQDA